jgi:rhamnosyltransferase
VSQAEHPEIFSMAKSESEGIRMVKETARYLIRIRKPWLILELILKSGCKYLGYLLGKSYRKLPRWLILRLTMNRAYWKK